MKIQTAFFYIQLHIQIISNRFLNTVQYINEVRLNL
jgi:hypothetical protein